MVGRRRARRLLLLIGLFSILGIGVQAKKKDDETRLFEGEVKGTTGGDHRKAFTPLKQLKKLARGTRNIFEVLVSTSPKKHGMGDKGKFPPGSAYIKKQQHDQLLIKIGKIVKFLFEKYTSDYCEEFGYSNNVITWDKDEVWTEEKQDEIFSMGVEVRFNANYPMRALFAHFGKWRKWINEEFSNCYNPNNRVNVRTRMWQKRGHNRFDKLEKKICKQIWNGRLNCDVADNPYVGNEKCEIDLFKTKKSILDKNN
jgi:hypothetical protein